MSSKGAQENKHVSSTKLSEKQQIYQAIAEYFYATNTPFQRVEHLSFRKLIQDLKEIIQGFLTCNPSTAPLERLFSTYRWMHDEHRNRMGNEKASKLLFCFKTLN